MLLGLAAAGIGFNIQHDGGHHAYSRHPWINTLMALTLDPDRRQLLCLALQARRRWCPA
jgi:hypothetical protein